MIQNLLKGSTPIYREPIGRSRRNFFPGIFWGGISPCFSSSALNFKELFVENQFTFQLAVGELKELLKLVNTSDDIMVVTAKIKDMAGSSNLPRLNVFC